MQCCILQVDLVKLQIINLAAKLCIVNPKQTRLLCQYVLSLAQYDQSYDIRDRSRFVRAIVLPASADKESRPTAGHFAKRAKNIFLAIKPTPILESAFRERCLLQVSSSTGSC